MIKLSSINRKAPSVQRLPEPAISNDLNILISDIDQYSRYSRQIVVFLTNLAGCVSDALCIMGFNLWNAQNTGTVLPTDNLELIMECQGSKVPGETLC